MCKKVAIKIIPRTNREKIRPTYFSFRLNPPPPPPPQNNNLAKLKQGGKNLAA